MNPQLLLSVLLEERVNLNRSISRCRRRIAFIENVEWAEKERTRSYEEAKAARKLPKKLFPIWGENWLAIQGITGYDEALASREFWRAIGC